MKSFGVCVRGRWAFARVCELQDFIEGPRQQSSRATFPNFVEKSPVQPTCLPGKCYSTGSFYHDLEF